MFDIEGNAVIDFAILAFLLWVQVTEAVFCAGCFIGARADQKCGKWRHWGRDISDLQKHCIGQGARQIKVRFQPTKKRCTLKSEFLGRVEMS